MKRGFAPVSLFRKVTKFATLGLMLLLMASTSPRIHMIKLCSCSRMILRKNDNGFTLFILINYSLLPMRGRSFLILFLILVSFFVFIFFLVLFLIFLFLLFFLLLFLFLFVSFFLLFLSYIALLVFFFLLKYFKAILLIQLESGVFVQKLLLKDSLNFDIFLLFFIDVGFILLEDGEI